MSHHHLAAPLPTTAFAVLPPPASIIGWPVTRTWHHHGLHHFGMLLHLSLKMPFPPVLHLHPLAPTLLSFESGVLSLLPPPFLRFLPLQLPHLQHHPHIVTTTPFNRRSDSLNGLGDGTPFTVC